MLLRQKFKKYLIQLIFGLKTHKIENSILIFSEARGGSTWLMELLKYIPGVLINWEPLHVDYGVVPKSYRFGWRPQLRIDEKDEKYRRLFSNILCLRIFNNWTAKYISLKDVFSSKYVLTKFVRANQCLPWFVNVFPNLDHTPIFLLRHPITTCVSRLKTFELTGNSDLNVLKKESNFEIPDCINNERFVLHKDYLNSLTTQLEFEVGIWCVNNADIVNHNENSKWCTVFYEDLLLTPKETFSEILNEIKIDLPDAIINQIQFEKPSMTNFGNLQSSKKLQLESFLTYLKKDELVKIQAVFDYFEFKIYSAFSAYPIKH